jgi:hypothetical protein
MKYTTIAFLMKVRNTYKRNKTSRENFLPIWADKLLQDIGNMEDVSDEFINFMSIVVQKGSPLWNPLKDSIIDSDNPNPYMEWEYDDIIIPGGIPGFLYPFCLLM